MYKNVGKKIQTLAKVIAWIGIVFFIILGGLSLYGGLNTADYNMIAQGIFCLLFGPLVSWLSSLTLVGFGKLIQTTEETKAEVEKIAAEVKKD